jgi:predicted XRE-type DNA-binding protein
MDAHQAKIEINLEEWMATVKASQERMETLMDVTQETMEDCLEKIEANQA